MKISGLSCETKKIFLFFLGHPIVHAILGQKNLTGLAGGVREGQNMAQNGPRLCTFLALEPSGDP